MTQSKNNAQIGEQVCSSIDLPGFQPAVRGCNLSTNRLRFISILRCKVRVVPIQITLEHLTHKKEAQFFTIVQFYIRMALQHLIEPGRAAPQGANSHKRWRTPVCKIAVPKQTFLR